VKVRTLIYLTFKGSGRASELGEQIVSGHRLSRPDQLTVPKSGPAYSCRCKFGYNSRRTSSISAGAEVSYPGCSRCPHIQTRRRP
jgi:hypothetical protein